jgi:hypothetical protein
MGDGNMNMNKTIAVWIVFLICLIAYSTVASARRPMYVGNLGCKCHKPNQDDWAKSVHGKAFETLMAKGRSKQIKKALRKAGLSYTEDYTEDEKCLPCHVVGYDEPGGYADKTSAKDLKDVGCEMCHGPGSEYRQIHEEKGTPEDAPGGKVYTRAEVKAAGQTFPKNDESVCRKCHDHKDSPFNSKTDAKYMFDYEEMIKLEKAWHKINKLEFKHE